jgi:hypothetical protein
MIDEFYCPIMNCPHYNKTNRRTFHTLTSLIRHLKSDEHKTSRHLLDHTECNKIKLFRCTHNDCSKSKDIFFTSKRAYNDHNKTHHTLVPQLCLEINQAKNKRQLQYTSIISNTTPNEDEPQLEAGIHDINENYKCEPPQFRSSWRRYLRGNNKIWFYQILGNIIKSICQSSITDDSEPFWWLLLHYEMLILAPTPNTTRRNICMKHVIARRLKQLQLGQIGNLLKEAYGFNNNWTTKNPRPRDKIDNSAAQVAADTDNYRTAITRACNFNKIATLDNNNKHTVKKLYPNRLHIDQHNPQYRKNIQEFHLPGTYAPQYYEPDATKKQDYIVIPLMFSYTWSN